MALVLCLLTGAYFTKAALVAALYVVFMAFAFHGPAHWKPHNPTEFGFFVDHFTLIAGLLFAAVHGTGLSARVAQELYRTNIAALVGSSGKRNGNAATLPSW
jgi:putative oxidoreductase